MAKIKLIPIAPVNIGIVEQLVDPLQEQYSAVVEIDSKNSLKAETAFNPSRAQYNSSQLLLELLSIGESFQGKILGVTAVDLFIPVLTYVFGEAQLNGTVSIMSTYRLSETLYGLPENNSLLVERAIKEAVHELGHTFGLFHCRNYECAMHSSTSIEEVDIKGSQLCLECFQQLSAKLL